MQAAPPFVRVSSDDQEQDTKPARSSTLASSEELTTVTAMLDSRSTVSDEVCGAKLKGTILGDIAQNALL